MVTALSCLPEAAAPDAGHRLEIFSYLSQEICVVPNLTVSTGALLLTVREKGLLL